MKTRTTRHSHRNGEFRFGTVWLPYRMLLDVFRAVIALDLDRDVLVGGLDAGFVSGLRIVSTKSGQVLSDLQSCNRTPPLVDRSIAIVLVLQTAKALSGPRVESEVFRRALDHVRGRLRRRALRRRLLARPA